MPQTSITELNRTLQPIIRLWNLGSAKGIAAAFVRVFATICIESGVDIPTVSRWLGHADGRALVMAARRVRRRPACRWLAHGSLITNFGNQRRKSDGFLVMRPWRFIAKPPMSISATGRFGTLSALRA